MKYEDLENLIVAAAEAVKLTAKTPAALRALKEAARGIERGMMDRAAAKAERSQDAATFPGLSVRAVRALKVLGVETRAAARTLDRKTVRAVTGWGTVNEIREWAHADMPND